MKVIIRAKRGEPVQVLNENGSPIPGLKRAEVRLEVGQPATVYLVIEGASVVVDAFAVDAFVNVAEAEPAAPLEQPKSEPAA
jgi:hypothetical protein